MNNAIVNIGTQMSEPWLSILLGTLFRDGLDALCGNSIFYVLWKTATLCPNAYGVLWYMSTGKVKSSLFPTSSMTLAIFSPLPPPFTANYSDG